MLEPCPTCPIDTTGVSEVVVDEIARRRDFERSEEEHLADGSYSRFVDGAFFVADDTPQLTGDQAAMALRCAQIQAAGNCPTYTKNQGGEN